MLEQIHQKPISSSKNNSDSDIILQVQALKKEFSLHEQNKVLPGFPNLTLNEIF
ncbi:MAG: hypothetical protein AAFR37_01180 [Cyanobacteria bacterium J06628_3]